MPPPRLPYHIHNAGVGVTTASREESLMGLSVLLNLCAAAALTAASAVTFRAAMLPVWAGALLGLCLYAGAFVLTFLAGRPEDG
jgi:hypothetical protein